MDRNGIICSCGECYACDARDRLWEPRGANVSKYKKKSPEKEFEWNKFWNEMLWKVRQDAIEHKKYRDKLYNKGI